MTEIDTGRRAGLTERYFYESFAGRDELLVAVPDRVVLTARDTLITALHTSPTEPHDLIRHVVRAFTDFI
ncbi:hypothetical protein GXW84_23285 [Rhodococcus sp. IEGM 248]|uniref:hypothetical protein n=1 Tax=Rhodococcus opacus TaxID=37919 RepID=UPI0013C1646E|nr:hypothetical protein [Rhodococcus sp. IEGM 248]